jgi:hypothetical protein
MISIKNNKKEYLSPCIQAISINEAFTLLASSDHKTDDNFAKINNFFIDEQDEDSDNN